MHDLRNCPFCGCIAFLHGDGGNRLGDGTQIAYRVECEGTCHAMTCYWHTEEQAIAAWNKRVDN